MGNKSKPILIQDLEYYSTVNDHNYSCVDVYTSKHMPVSFIAKARLNASEEALFEKYCDGEGTAYPNLLVLYYISKEKECECKHLLSENLVSYWEYYNFFLNDLIQRREAKGVQFSEEELWYLAKVCTQGYGSLYESGVYYEFSP